MTMERYDGKTRKDDIKKYVLIAAAVILVIVLYKVLTGVIYTVSHPDPDMVVVYGAAMVTDFQMEDEMEYALKEYGTDLDDSGKTVVDVVPYDIRQNSAMAESGVGNVGAEDGRSSFISRLRDGNGLIFVTHDEALLKSFNEDNCAELPEKMADKTYPFCVDISGCQMLEEQGIGDKHFYGAISKNASPEEYEAAVTMLRSLMKTN